MTENRSWDKWDDPGVAEDIDRLWLNDPGGYEAIHRTVLAGLVKNYLVSPTERVLEVGSGTGLIYGVLVPDIIANSCYIGVDTSTKMLEIARNRYPMGRFIYGDAYDLPFISQSFEVALCFEVLGHLPEIQRPIDELFRVTRRLLIFTVWVSPEKLTVTSNEQIRESKFLHQLYAQDEVKKAIYEAAKGEEHSIEIRVLSDTAWAYIVSKGRPRQGVQDSPVDERILPFPGLSDLLIRSLQEKETELTQARGELEKMADLEKRYFEVSSKGKMAALEIDRYRQSRLAQLFNRFIDKSNLWNDISPAFQQLKDDSLIFNRHLKGFRLKTSINLQRVPLVHFPLELNRKNLSGILLALIVDFPLVSGSIGIEILSSDNSVIGHATLPLDNIDTSLPTRFDFPAVKDSDKGQLGLRVFLRDAGTPVRIFEFQKYKFFRFGPLITRAFCGFLFDDSWE